MTKTVKIWLIAAALLVILGTAILGVTVCSEEWDLTKLENYETNIYEITEEFYNISMNTDTADILFVMSDDGKCQVVCFEKEKQNHSVYVQNNTLVINIAKYNYIGFINKTKITVYLPKAEYSSLFIKESTGDIEVPKSLKFKSVDCSLSTGDVNFFASVSEALNIATSTGDICVKTTSSGSIALSVSTGKVTVSDIICEGNITVGVTTGKAYMTNIKCKNFISDGNTGDISLNNVIVTEKFSVKRTTGNIKFEGCDAAEIFVKTNTGDVEGSLLTDKIFITKTDTGRINVPNSVTGGRCEITTDTGDIKIQIIGN